MGDLIRNKPFGMLLIVDAISAALKYASKLLGKLLGLIFGKPVELIIGVFSKSTGKRLGNSIMNFFTKLLSPVSNLAGTVFKYAVIATIAFIVILVITKFLQKMKRKSKGKEVSKEVMKEYNDCEQMNSTGDMNSFKN